LEQIGDLVTNTEQHRSDDFFQLSDLQSGSRKPENNLDRASLARALDQLHRLLEEYAPSWYTQKHHETALAALDSLKKY